MSALHPKTPLISEGFYGTLFKQRRGFYGPPRVDLSAKRGIIPAQPQPVSIGPTSMLGSLMGYIGPRQTLTGEEADALRESLLDGTFWADKLIGIQSLAGTDRLGRLTVHERSALGEPLHPQLVHQKLQLAMLCQI